MIPGEILFGEEPVVINSGHPVSTVRVLNTGDRPVQVGSHYHFAEANPALEFDRAAAWGLRLAVPAGTSVRFEPGVTREVRLVPLGGRRIVAGLRGECAGPLDRAGHDRAETGTAESDAATIDPAHTDETETDAATIDGAEADRPETGRAETGRAETGRAETGTAKTGGPDGPDGPEGDGAEDDGAEGDGMRR